MELTRSEYLDTVTPLSPNFNSIGLDVLPQCFDGASGTFGTRLEDLCDQGESLVTCRHLPPVVP